jgi:hypothetical protein
MANNTPLSGLTDAAGGIILPEAQGDLLTNGVLNEGGAISIAGDRRATSSRREAFAIWNGTPTAEFVGEGGTKPVTGAEFAGGTLNIKKLATIITFTDEMLEDVQSGDLNVLVDSGIRTAIRQKIDAHVVGRTGGADVTTSFDNSLRSTTSAVELGGDRDAFQLAISAAMGSLEANGYTDLGVVIPADAARYIRDARTGGTVEGLYQQFGADPFYGLPRAVSSNLDGVTSTAGTTDGNNVVAYVVSRPNLHVRIRKDVTVTPSREATVGGTSLYQNDLTALRYVTRLGFWIHDVNRAVVKVENSA